MTYIFNSSSIGNCLSILLLVSLFIFMLLFQPEESISALKNSNLFSTIFNIIVKQCEIDDKQFDGEFVIILVCRCFVLFCVCIIQI